MKKLLILPAVLIMFMLVPVLAACGGGSVKVESIEISGASEIAPNTPTTYTATVLPADAKDKTVTWAVVSGYATITSDGLLTATGTGTIVISASAGGKHTNKTILATTAVVDNAAIA